MNNLRYGYFWNYLPADYIDCKISEIPNIEYYNNRKTLQMPMVKALPPPLPNNIDNGITVREIKVIDEQKSEEKLFEEMYNTNSYTNDLKKIDNNW